MLLAWLLIASVEKNVRITKRQLRRIIREAVTHDPREQSAYRARQRRHGGSQKGLEQRVYDYLIDVGVYKGLSHAPHIIDVFSSGGHPEGGTTHGARAVLEDAVESGDIDWASWHEIDRVWKKIDKMVD